MNIKHMIKEEEMLLLGLCRLEFNVEHRVKVKALTEGEIDWKYFASLANAHGVAALVYYNLDKLGFLKVVPEEVVIFLRGSLLKSLSRNTYNTETMVEVLRLLDEAGIKTVLLKGFSLEQTVYGNAGLRQMTDVDILTSREQCIKARNILIRNGFVSLPAKSIFHNLIIADLGKHLPSLTKNGVSVEIHNDLFGKRKNILTRLFYNSSYEIDIKGEKAYVPQPLIFILYLVRHLYLHEINNESQLRLYTDLVVLIEKHYKEIINHDLLMLASKAGLSEILAWRLGSLRDFWDISFPEWIDDFIDIWYNPDSINKFVSFLKSPKDNPPPDKPFLYRHLVNNIPGIHRKFLFLLGDIFPSISFMKKRYKSSKAWRVIFFYPHRLGKLLWLFRR